jgi:phosphotransferase system enzyme I (PtsP)
MFPMIAEVAEFDSAHRILSLELARARLRGLAVPARLAVGVMLEVPALIWQLPALCRQVDFISVGSNDLFQFLFASDRGNARLADRYDVLSPPALKCLAEIVERTAAAGVQLSLCGEMASNPLEAMALIGLGFRSLSMAPSAIGPVKAMVRSVALAPLARYLGSLLDEPDHSVRERLREFARDHAVALR